MPDEMHWAAPFIDYEGYPPLNRHDLPFEESREDLESSNKDAQLIQAANCALAQGSLHLMVPSSMGIISSSLLRYRQQQQQQQQQQRHPGEVTLNKLDKLTWHIHERSTVRGEALLLPAMSGKDAIDELDWYFDEEDTLEASCSLIQVDADTQHAPHDPASDDRPAGEQQTSAAA